MAYDEELADRIRELIADEPDLTEKKMFGGLAFLIGGNMAVAASGEGGLLVRVDPSTVGGARRDLTRPPHGDARPEDAGLAARRNREPSNEQTTRSLGGARHLLRPLATGKAIALPAALARPSAASSRASPATASQHRYVYRVRSHLPAPLPGHLPRRAGASEQAPARREVLVRARCDLSRLVLHR